MGARRALQNCIYQKNFKPPFWGKKFKKLLGKFQQNIEKTDFFDGRETLDFSIKLTFFITFTILDVSKCIH